MTDLHVHSSFSDGDLTIEQITQKAKEDKLAALAITDHDNIDSCKYISSNISKENLVFIPGVELSTESYILGNKTKIHLLGYGFDYTDNRLNQALKNIYDNRASHNKIYLQETLKVLKFLKEEMFEGFDYGKYGWIRKLILKQVSEHITREQYDTLNYYLSDNKPVYQGYNFKVEDAIELIKNAGGYPILAHPFEYKITKDNHIKLVEYLASIGLLGIETYHNDISFEYQEFFHTLADKHNLYETGGSDFHRANQDNLGCYFPDTHFENNQFVKKLILENKIIGGNDGRE